MRTVSKNDTVIAFAGALFLFLTLAVGCSVDDTRDAISCAEVVSAYEEAGYEVWHREYTAEERDYLCEVVAETEAGEAIYFTFYDSADKAEQHVKDSRWNGLLWAYSLVSGDPTWVYTEAYDTVAIQYENKDLYAPFRDLK